MTTITDICNSLLSRVCLRGFSAVLAACLVTSSTAIPVFADSPEFNRDIRPILADHCFACHGADSGSREAELRLDERDAAVEAGAITPGEVDKSELIARILTDDPELIMPPLETKKSLSAEQKKLLGEWVTSGAEYQPHWSFIAPTRPELPAVANSNWTKNAIDQFTLARLEANGLTPAGEADARTLFRRLHLDITGLPPKPDDVDKFVVEYSQQKDAALSEWIDKLMQSTAWGEHRARYWLDAARYGDTHGLHFDNYREMWLYRDWVVRAFNSNQPFDQFTIEQLAGDLLPDPSDDQLIATGFQRCNITTNEGGTIDEENLANYAVDRVQTFGWVYLGLTTNCGQCHNHKFDPFSMKDFYSLAAYFRNTTQGPKDGNVKDGRGPILVVPAESDRPRWKALPSEIAAAIASREARKKAARPNYDQWLAAVTPESIAGSIPSEGLVAHVPLNDGEGNVIRIAVGRSDSITAAGEVAWVDGGKTGRAPVIKADSTFEVGAVGDFERSDSFSYGAWVKTARNNTQAAIIARMDEKAEHRGWDLWQNGRSFGAHIIDSWPNNGLKVITRASVVKPGKWQHVFITYDGSGKPTGVKIYVDGNEQAVRVEKNTLNAQASIRTSTPLKIGQRSHGSVFKDGAVQDVRIYEGPLTAAQVKSIADGPVLQRLLKTTVDKRTPQQRNQLFNHFLTSVDTQYPALVKAVSDLEGEREAIRSRSPVTHIQQEKANSTPMAHILMRGEYDKPLEQVSATTPAALHPLAGDAPQNRLGLARWVIDPANPLTARVTVNRFWQEVFGRGIVATPEDFGVMGAPPTHPELLDWLAVEFQSSGWDVKKLFKLMLMSATYRQAAITTKDKLEKDRENILLSRGPRFRMDAEMVRDYALATSGLLSSKMYGPGVKPYQPEGIWDIVGLPGGNTRNYVRDRDENLYRRTLYTFWKRMAPPPNLEAFNAPSREVCTVRRERTNTPLQALVTLNDPQFVEAARNLAEAAIATGTGDDATTINEIAQRVLCRSLNAREVAILQSSKQELLAFYQSHPEDAKTLIDVGESAVNHKLDTAKLAAWTMVCNQVMNLDEALNK